MIILFLVGNPGFQTTDPYNVPPVESWFTTPSNIIVRTAINPTVMQQFNSKLCGATLQPGTCGNDQLRDVGGMTLSTSCNKWVNIFNLYPVMLEVAKPSAPWPIEVTHAVNILENHQIQELRSNSHLLPCSLMFPYPALLVIVPFIYPLNPISICAA